MKHRLPAIAIAYTATTCVVAENNLAPCTDDFPSEYEQRVEAIAQAAMPGPADFWVTVIPSFTPEWSVGVSTVEGRHVLTHVAFNRSFWHSSWIEAGPNQAINDPSKGRARAKARSTTITSALYAALWSEWDRSVNATRQSDVLVLDGVAFNFRLPDRCATTSFPEPATRNGELVGLVNELVRLARTKNRAPDPTMEGEAMRMLRELPSIVD